MKKLTHCLTFEVGTLKIRVTGTTLIEDAPEPKPKSDNKPTSEESRWCATLYGRPHESAWSDKEIGAFVKHKALLTPENRALIQKLYDFQRAQPKKGIPDYSRKDLQTFLNNVPGECDRALAHSKQPQINGTHRPNTPAGSRSSGSANAGMSGQYAGVGRVAGGSEAQA